MDNQNINFTLSLENFKSIPLHKFEKDFTFIVNGIKYQTSRIIAEILSPKIRNLHFTDDCINEYIINIEEKTYQDYFNDFLNLTSFDNSTLDSLHQKYYSEFFLLLGNIDEYFRIQPEIINEITNDNAVDILISISHKYHKIYKKIEFNSQIDLNSLYNIESVHKVISFISSNFEKVKKSRLTELDISLLEQIISNENLQILEEDSLLMFAISLYEKDSQYTSLFEHILFQNVSEKALSTFINKFNLEDINYSIWNSICNRLVPTLFNDDKEQENIDLKERKIFRYIQKVSEFEHQKGNELHGILRHLTEKTGGNIHDNGTIDISSNSIWNDDHNRYHPKNLVDYNNDNYYDSKIDGNAFICFDFKEKSIQLSCYSIESDNAEEGSGHLRNWIIEVSNNAQNWIEIDRHENDGTLNGPSIIATFNIRKKQNDFYRFIRLRQTGNSWINCSTHNQFYFPFIEFYGKLRQPLV